MSTLYRHNQLPEDRGTVLLSLAHKTTSLKMGIKNSANRSSFFELIFKQGAAASFLAHNITSLKMGRREVKRRGRFFYSYSVGQTKEPSPCLLGNFPLNGIQHTRYGFKGAFRWFGVQLNCTAITHFITSLMFILR